jgi:IS30 family transposase
VIDRKRLEELDELGYSTREIGQELGVSAASVSRLLRRHRIPQNPAAGL